MSGWVSLRDWFAGNGRYTNLVHCMGHDTFWIVVTVTLDFAVAAGYLLIALHWWKNQRYLADSPAKHALGNMRNIFLFCGICGYLFIPVKMVWPAWRLYDIVMLALGYYTWRYAVRARGLKVVYNELGRSARLKQDLEESREQSRRKSFFLNAVSHDLRTPLNGLLLQGTLAEVGVATNNAETVLSAVREMKASAKAAAELLDGLLDYARLESGADTPSIAAVDLSRLVNDVVAASTAAASRKGICLRSSVPAGLVVHSDRQRVERVLTNLVTNAVKFTDQGGIRVEADRDANSVRIHVIDTGIGIVPEHRERLFEEFFQANNPGRDRSKGFGLGLAIARSLARQLRGDVTVEGEPGGGSRFTLVLPTTFEPTSSLTAPQPAKDGAAATPAQAALGATKELPVSSTAAANR